VAVATTRGRSCGWFSMCGAQGGYGMRFPAMDALLLPLEGAAMFFFARAHGWVWGASPCYGRRRRCSERHVEA